MPPKNHGWAEGQDFRETNCSAQFVPRHRAHKYFQPGAAVRRLGARSCVYQADVVSLHTHVSTLIFTLPIASVISLALPGRQSGLVLLVLFSNGGMPNKARRSGSTTLPLRCVNRSTIRPAPAKIAGARRGRTQGRAIKKPRGTGGPTRAAEVWGDHKKEHPSAVRRRFGGMWMTLGDDAMIWLAESDRQVTGKRKRPPTKAAYACSNIHPVERLGCPLSAKPTSRLLEMKRGRQLRRPPLSATQSEQN